MRTKYEKHFSNYEGQLLNPHLILISMSPKDYSRNF
jgi:hypothetical protein